MEFLLASATHSLRNVTSKSFGAVGKYQTQDFSSASSGLGVVFATFSKSEEEEPDLQKTKQFDGQANECELRKPAGLKTPSDSRQLERIMPLPQPFKIRSESNVTQGKANGRACVCPQWSLASVCLLAFIHS